MINLLRCGKYFCGSVFTDFLGHSDRSPQAGREKQPGTVFAQPDQRFATCFRCLFLGPFQDAKYNMGGARFLT